MKKFLLYSIFGLALLGYSGSKHISEVQARIVGGPCDTAFDEYGGQNPIWNAACINYAIAIGECYDAGDCDIYGP